MKTPKLKSVLIVIGIILLFTVFRIWTSRNIDHLEHETIAFENLPTEVQHYLENPTDVRSDVQSMILELPKNKKPQYKLETVKTLIGPWVDHEKLINIQTERYYEIDQGVPSPYIVYENNLYIPNTYNIFTTVNDLKTVKFKRYYLDD